MTTLTCAWPVDSRVLTAALSQTGLDVTAEPGALREKLRTAIAQRGGWVDWSVDHTGWVVTLYLPKEQTFAGPTLEDGLTACFTWLVALASRTESGTG
jgi:hypothetical protein